MQLLQPYLLFLADVAERPNAKTALGLRDSAPERCVGEFALPQARVTTGLPDFVLPSLEEAIALHLLLGRRTNRAARCAGVSLNTSKLSAQLAHALLARCSADLGVPCADPILGGPSFDALVSACLRARQ